MDRWWINGKPGRLVDVTDRGLAYGDGLFETIAIRAGQPRFLELHLDRLLDGLSRLGIPPPDRAALARDLALSVTGMAHGVLKLVVTRGPGPRGYRPPAQPASTIAWGTEESTPQPAHPVAARWCETMVAPNPATAGLKSLNRLEQVLARAEWSDPDVAEGLMTSTDGQLVGGTSSNVFVVACGQLLTPDVAHAGIAGVMRRAILEAARGAGIPVLETRIVPGDVPRAAEVFLSNALTGIRPVHRLGAQRWGPGPVTRRLQVLLYARGVGECAASY
ncbi:MAG: aminodeoxychorismate lyase [Gammaproteobacteria bacterium]